MNDLVGCINNIGGMGDFLNARTTLSQEIK